MTAENMGRLGSRSDWTRPHPQDAGRVRRIVVCTKRVVGRRGASHITLAPSMPFLAAAEDGVASATSEYPGSCRPRGVCVSRAWPLRPGADTATRRLPGTFPVDKTERFKPPVLPDGWCNQDGVDGFSPHGIAMCHAGDVIDRQGNVSHRHGDYNAWDRYRQVGTSQLDSAPSGGVRGRAGSLLAYREPRGRVWWPPRFFVV